VTCTTRIRFFPESVSVTAPGRADSRQKGTAASPEPASLALWWTRDFRGNADQVREVRRWIEDLLPDCDVLADLLLLASELCTNAIAHTWSGWAGGRFSVSVEWAPVVARLVIGDQGSAAAPAMGARTGDTDWTAESGRGLRLVNELADDWGMASHAGRRWVWADLKWQANGGRPLDVPGGRDAAIAGIAVIRKEFPGTTIWWGNLTKVWWATVPGAIDASDLICSPTHDRLSQALAEAYPSIQRGAPWCVPDGARNAYGVCAATGATRATTRCLLPQCSA
jgi:serine/threonine-protein kinase RsbW